MPVCRLDASELPLVLSQDSRIRGKAPENHSLQVGSQPEGKGRDVRQITDVVIVILLLYKFSNSLLIYLIRETELSEKGNR
jgi:hypothetical protein